jgi:peptidoglycan/LPS O-acetylase OafA/YrhL
LLLAEHAASGRIDLRAFWARRARRLLPALLLVLVAVAVYAAVVARPGELDRIRRDGLAALLYVANWRMVFGGESYFESFEAPSPLRHAWSLGIEEQWYVVWPLVVSLVLAATRRRWLGAVCIVLAAASATAMAVLAAGAADPSRAYYGTDARAQGLLLGALLAVVLSARPARRTRWIDAAGIIGLAVVVAMVVGVDDGDRWLYRGGFGLAAVASCLVVAAAVQPSGVVRSLLSLRPLRAVGALSYGLYLWHWPVYVVLSPSRTALSDGPLLAVRLAVSALLAAVSFVLVERPVRAGRVRVPRPRVAVPAVGATVAALFVVVTVAPPPAPAPIAAAAVARAPALDRPARVLVVGDSVALTLAAGVDARVLGGRATVQSDAILGCGVVRVTRFAGPLTHVPADDCRRWPSRWRSAIERYDPDVAVLLVGAWEVFDVEVDGRRLPFGAPAHEALVRHELSRALEVLGAGRTEVVALTAPCFDHHDDAEFRHGSERNDPRRVAWVNRLLHDAVAARPSDARLVDLHAIVCPGGRYAADLRGAPLRADDGVHFDVEGVPLVWAKLLPDVLAAAQESATP